MTDSETSDYISIPTFEAHLPPITNVSLYIVQMSTCFTHAPTLLPCILCICADEGFYFSFAQRNV